MISYVLEDPICRKFKKEAKQSYSNRNQIKGCISGGESDWGRGVRKLPGQGKCCPGSGDGYMVFAFVRIHGVLHLGKFYFNKNTE